MDTSTTEVIDHSGPERSLTPTTTFRRLDENDETSIKDQVAPSSSSETPLVAASSSGQQTCAGQIIDNSDGQQRDADKLPQVNELQSPKSSGTNPNNTSGKNSSSSTPSGMRNNASSGGGGGGGNGASGNRDSLKQRKTTSTTPVDLASTGGSNPIHHIAASGSPTLRRGPAGSVGVDTSRRASTGPAPSGTANNSSSRNTTKPCCFCWCCCYRCSCLSSRNQEEELSKSKDLTSRDSWSNDPEVTPSIEEIRCWGDSFDRLMKSPMGRTVFREFLKCEYSEENILFWLACEDLKKDNNPEVVEEKARVIYEDYISILSPKEVSLDSRVREIVNRNMVDPTPHTFDEAQLQIYTLMHRDSYPRFVNSAYYKKLAQLSSTSRKESSA
nr:EOG090X0IBZ [Scapholeberis mucronata]